MKSMFDNYFGGRISSRAQMQAKIRGMKVDGTVMDEAQKAVDDFHEKPPAEQVDAKVSFKKESSWKVERSEKSAPYVGERY